MIGLNRLLHGLTRALPKVKLNNELCQDQVKPAIYYLYITFLVTDLTISLITFMVSARYEGPKLSATSSAFTNVFLFEVLRLWFAKDAWLLKCLLHSEQGILTSKKAHRGLAIQSLHVWSHMCVTSRIPLCYMLYIVLLRHCARYIHVHVIVSFGIVIG